MSENVVSRILEEIPLPRMVRVRQNFDNSHVEDVPAELRRQLASEKFEGLIRPGMSIAITCGSRGITNYPEVLRELASICKEAGAHPFIIPAMGSHAGATAQGQKRMCESLGVTEAFCGCPIRATMDTVEIGRTREGYAVEIDRYAAQADGIIVCNRIKAHPVLYGSYESGLCKMITIGLGKQHGAQIAHQLGWLRMTHTIEEFAHVTVQKAKVLFGVGLVENAYEQTCRLAALLPQEIFEQEPVLLAEAKEKMARILLRDTDVMVIDRIGKDISGDGMDPHVTGKFCEFYKGPVRFERKHIAVLDLTEATHGNYTGIEAADVVSQRVIDKADIDETYPNSLSSCSSQPMPMHMKNDRETIQCAIKITSGVQPKDIRMIRIPDTLHLTELQVSESMLAQVAQCPGVEIIGEPEDWTFDENGNLW